MSVLINAQPFSISDQSVSRPNCIDTPKLRIVDTSISESTMTLIEIHTLKLEVEICDNCSHEVWTKFGRFKMINPNPNEEFSLGHL